jgi:CrcB protein
MTALYFAIAAGIGGALRFVLDQRFPPVGQYAFPRSTFVANAVGSFLLGLVSTFNSQMMLILGVGFCGALTTFSAVALQLAKRAQARAIGAMLFYLLTMLSAAVLLAAFGHWLGTNF